MYKKLTEYLVKPMLYAPSTMKFWDDEHISKGMLDAHLNPNWEAATRKHDFVDKSVKWIASIAPIKQFYKLLDLGCGPGIYAERFSQVGYLVTGIDYSRRSIEYAKKQTLTNKSNINYHYKNYLEIDFGNEFDVATLIYCDYAPFSITERHILLKKIYQALKPNGKLIFDVFTPGMRKAESHTWEYNKDGGFFSEKPHLFLESYYQYDDNDKTELCQNIILTEEAVNCINIWDHYFTKEKLLSEIKPIGFSATEFFGDIAGQDYSDTSKTICCVLTK